MKKSLYLFLALLLPGLIFVFLKFAGKNEFTVPVFHENGVEAPPASCGMTYSSPYRVPGSVLTFLEMSREANVLIFPVEGLNFGKLKQGINDELGTNKVGIIDAKALATDTARLDNWKKCIFLVSAPLQSVLVDSVGKIRGYYDLRSLKEVDRLRVELKILLKKY
ncbi:MAG: hypothetical protein WDN75_10520 [Bacteroidota bacterium]